MDIQELAGQIIQRANGHKRFIVAIAGPPGAGKSTLAEMLHRQLCKAGRISKIVPMDGFHLDNDELDKMGLRHRKGSPETFDILGFLQLVRNIRENRGSIQFPGFNRTADRVVDNHDSVQPTDEIVLLEGNYLLLKTDPWDRLAAHFDLTIFTNPGMEILKERLVQRWLDNDHSLEQATARAEQNDIPNAQTVISNSIKADITIDSGL